ncbi:MAG: hypothetical protein H6581_23215 [Bacteroidia bacterium]|nr:hypothetical protein [Bacteroidia bacterium]
MSLTQVLDQLENKYYEELDENRDKIIPELRKIHKLAVESGEEAEAMFREEMLSRFGGIYIPYLFWGEMAQFMAQKIGREVLFETIQAFTNSGFEDVECKRMKPLVLTYFSVEKPFEIDKLFSQVIQKAHPSVQEYFEKLLRFVEKNSTSVSMYIEKFQMLADMEPDFEMLKMPLVRLKEKMA